MPRLDDSGEAFLHAGRDAKGRVKRVWDDFTDFLLSDNVLEVAVGLMYELPFICSPHDPHLYFKDSLALFRHRPLYGDSADQAVAWQQRLPAWLKVSCQTYFCPSLPSFLSSTRILMRSSPY